MKELDTVEKLLVTFVESDAPFMVLVFLGFVFFAYMAIKVMVYVQGVNTKSNEQMEAQRKAYSKMFAEDRIRFDIRESKLLENLKENTTQLEAIAETLREVQTNYKSLEEKVTSNFGLIEYEIQVLKDKVNERIESSQTNKR